MAGPDDNAPAKETAVTEGQTALTAATTAAAEAARAANEDPTNTALAKKAEEAEQISQAIASLVTPSEGMSDEELIALAQRQKRMDAALGVVAAITGALYAMHKVLTNPTFQELLTKDMPEAARKAMTSGIQSVLQKVAPLFRAFNRFQEQSLRETTNNLFDASVDVAYALVELSDGEARDAAQKTADNIALVMGLVKKGGPLVLACIDLVQRCMAALANDLTTAEPDPETKRIGEMLHKALRARTAQRESDYAKNLEAGMKLLEAQRSAKLLNAGAVA